MSSKLNSSFIAEGSNLFYTDSRVQSKLSNVSGHIVPAVDIAYDLGSATNRFRDLYLSGNTLYMGGITLSDDNGTFSVVNANAEPISISLAANTTDDLVEGSNLYWTTARGEVMFDTRLATKSTSDLTEGSNLYYTEGRVDANIASKTTDDLAEGTNLYYTTARANADFDTRLATKTTDDVSEGSSNLYYTDARVGTYLTNNSYATQSYVTTAISNLVDAAPTTLDTLNELAAALGDDPNFATTVASSIGSKLDSSSYTASDVLTKIKTVDGSGSELDADLLDGQDGSYYLDWSNVTNKPDPIITVNLTGDVTGTGSTTLTDVASGTISISTTVSGGDVPYSVFYEPPLLKKVYNPNVFTSPANDVFSESHAISGNYIITGSYADGSSTAGGTAQIINATTGAVVFTFTNPNPTGTGTYDDFGVSVAIDGNYCAIGSNEDVGGNVSGVMYIYKTVSGDWTDASLVVQINNPSPANYAYFSSYKIAISGNYVFTAAPGLAVNTAASQGVAYIFNKDTGALIKTITSPTNLASVYFGANLAVYGNNLIIGTTRKWANLFKTTTGDWTDTTHVAQLDTNSINGIYENGFAGQGRQFAMNSNYAYIGATGADSNNGKVYVFSLTNGAIVHVIDNPNTANPNTTQYDQFGKAVAINSNYIAVAAYDEDALLSGDLDPGVVYVFDITTYELKYTIINNDVYTGKLSDWEAMGTSLGMTDTRLTISSWADNNYSGSLFIYDISNYSAGVNKVTVNDSLVAPNLYSNTLVSKNSVTSKQYLSTVEVETAVVAGQPLSLNYTTGKAGPSHNSIECTLNGGVIGDLNGVNTDAVGVAVSITEPEKFAVFDYGFVKTGSIDTTTGAVNLSSGYQYSTYQSSASGEFAFFERRTGTFAVCKYESNGSSVNRKSVISISWSAGLPSLYGTRLDFSYDWNESQMYSYNAGMFFRVNNASYITAYYQNGSGAWVTHPTLNGTTTLGFKPIMLWDSPYATNKFKFIGADGSWREVTWDAATEALTIGTQTSALGSGFAIDAYSSTRIIPRTQTRFLIGNGTDQYLFTYNMTIATASKTIPVTSVLEKRSEYGGFDDQHSMLKSGGAYVDADWSRVIHPTIDLGSGDYLFSQMSFNWNTGDPSGIANLIIFHHNANTGKYQRVGLIGLAPNTSGNVKHIAYSSNTNSLLVVYNTYNQAYYERTELSVFKLGDSLTNVKYPAENFIGISQDIADYGPVSVAKVDEISTVHSNLTYGKKYYINKTGGLTTDFRLWNGSNFLQNNAVGRAISSTELLITRSQTLLSNEDVGSKVPTNVSGASKMFAETFWYDEARQEANIINLMTDRFGYMKGSNYTVEFSENGLWSNTFYVPEGICTVFFRFFLSGTVAGGSNTTWGEWLFFRNPGGSGSFQLLKEVKTNTGLPSNLTVVSFDNSTGLVTLNKTGSGSAVLESHRLYRG